MEIKYYLLLALLIWNLVVFFVYAADKLKARRGRYRISERTLILIAFLGGGVGAMLGIHLLRHKITYLKFTVCAPVALILTVAIAVFIFAPGIFGLA